jgi:hypothetical protein
MLSNTPIIASLVNQSSIPMVRKAIGTIEKSLDHSNFILKINNERIPIQTENGNLQPGDIVSCTIQKNKVILEKISLKRQDYRQSNDSITPEDTVNLKDTEKEIDSWPKSMKSRALQSIDPLILKAVVEQQGFLSLDTLHQIDDLLFESNYQVPPARAGSTSAQLAANGQWLLTLFENQIPPVKLIPFFPVSSAAALSGTLEEVASVLNALPLSIQNMPFLEDYAITPGSMLSIGKTEIIPETVKRLGFDFENTIAENIVPKNNLKGELLKILGLLDNALSSQPQITVRDFSQSELPQNSTAVFDELERNLLKIVENISYQVPSKNDIRLETEADSSLLQIITEINRALEQLEKETSNNISIMPPFKIPDNKVLAFLLSIMGISNSETLLPEVLMKKFTSAISEYSSSGQQSINKATQLLSDISGILKAAADLRSAQNPTVSETDMAQYKVNTAKELMTFAVYDFISELKSDLITPDILKKVQNYPEQIKNEFTRPELKQLPLSQAEVNLAKLRFEIIKTVSSLTSDISEAPRLFLTAGYGSAAQITESMTDDLLSIPMNAFSTLDSRISQINLLIDSIRALSNKENGVPGSNEVFNEKFGIIRNAIPELSSIIPDKSQLLKATMEQLSKLTSDISTFSAIFSKAIPQSLSELSLKAVVPEAIRFFEIHLSNLSNQLRHELKEISSGIEQVRTRLDSLSHSDLQKLNPANSGGNIQSTMEMSKPDQTIVDHSAAGQIRQPLENLLNRLESLQLLSRPTQTLSGDQHILALPMKIGGEWTEVNVKFVKRRNRERKNSQNQHYSVSLNVSPSRLGAIEVRMEYDVKKSLRLSMTFENEFTANWFIDHNDQFRKAIEEIGLPITRFELHKRTLTKAATQVSKEEKDGFDITV